MATKSRTIRFRVTEDEEKFLKGWAARRKCSLSDLIREMLELGDVTPRDVEEMTVQYTPSDFERRVKQLQAQGMTGPVARAMAQQEIDKL